jgi:hypothetical protein
MGRMGCDIWERMGREGPILLCICRILMSARGGREHARRVVVGGGGGGGIGAPTTRVVDRQVAILARQTLKRTRPQLGGHAL